MTVQAVSAVDSKASGNLLAVCANVPLDALPDLLEVGQPSTCACKQYTHALRHRDLLGVITIELCKRLADFVLQFELPGQAGLALDLLGQGVVIDILKRAREKAVRAAGESRYEARKTDERTKATPHDHAIILPETGTAASRRSQTKTHHQRGNPSSWTILIPETSAGGKLPPKSARPTSSSCCGRPSGNLWRPMCEGILRSAHYAVKGMQAPYNEVILVIASGRYKSLKLFIKFERNKNYDTTEITRY